jgi:tungstate transport system substrate-binding protein
MAVVALLVAVLAGCPAPQPGAPANPELILATTSSTQDSGLLDVLVPMFQTQTGYKVKTIALGSGAAMAMGEKGEADVLLVHSPADEAKFMDARHGIDRKLVMHNDFIILGPKTDPAGIKGIKVATDAFKKIAEKKTLFVNRGDRSGTDSKEQSIWKAASLTPAGQSWYQVSGQGMGASLAIASEKQAYILSDRATFLSNVKGDNLVILVEGDTILLNIYHVIQVNPNKTDKINAAGAKAFADFMVAKATQDVIAKFGVDRYGAPLFFPDASKPEYS